MHRPHCTPHTSYLPFRHYTAWCVLVLACMLAAPIAVHAQEAVPLTLNYHEDLEEEGPLPDSTEVLVYHEAGTRATPLSAWGSRQAMGDALAAKADESFGEVFSRIGSDGATDSVRVATEPEEIAYVLARVPEDSTVNGRLYESQVGGEDVEPGPGLDLVVSGNMDMSTVSEQDTDWAKSTFERAVKTPLTLASDSISFPEDADVRVWTRSVEDSTAFSRDELNHSDSTATTVTADETIEDRFERTAYSDKVVYVVVRTTNAEGEPVLYESKSEGDDDAADFVSVTDGTITMQSVPEQHQATMAELFPAPGGNEWFTWTFYGLVALVSIPLLLVVVLIVGRGLTKKKEKKNRRRQNSKRKGFWEARSPSASEPEPNKETSEQELIEGEADAPQASEESDAMAALRKEKDAAIEALRKKLQEKDKKLRSKNQTIQKLKKQSNGAARPQSQPKPRRPST